MVNEEDHLRLQSIRSGFALEPALAVEGVEGPDPNEHAHADEHAHDSQHDQGAHHEHGAHDHDHGQAHASPESRGHDVHHARAQHTAHSTAHASHHAAHDAHGGHHDHGAHEPHESPKVITVALMILGFLGLFGGHFWLTAPQTAFSGHPWFEQLVSVESLYGEEIAHWIAPEPSGEAAAHHEHLDHAAHLRALIVSLIVATSGIALAWFLYVRRIDLPGRIVAGLGQVYTAVRRKYFVDEVVDATVIRGTMRLAKMQRSFDENVVDGLVRFVGQANKLGGTFSAWFDKTFIDGAVNGLALASQVFGAAFRLIQTGRIQQYAAFAMGGALLTAAWLILA